MGGVLAFDAGGTTRHAVHEPTPVVVTADEESVMMADDVIRRLRRLGLNFMKNRIANPYDPYGEVC